MKENLIVVAFYAAILAGLCIVIAVLFEFLKNNNLGKYRIFALILGFLFIGSPFIGKITLKLPGEIEVIVEKMDQELESLTVSLNELESEHESLQAEISDLYQEMDSIISQVRSGQITRDNYIRIFTDISGRLEYISNQSDTLSVKLQKAREENNNLRKNMKDVVGKIN